MAAKTTRRLTVDNTQCCIRCKRVLPVDNGEVKGAFRLIHPYADGTPRWASSCRECQAQTKRTALNLQHEETLWATVAPRQAAAKLLATNDEVLAEIIRRYHHLYIPLLEQERANLMERRRQYVERQRLGRQHRKA